MNSIALPQKRSTPSQDVTQGTFTGLVPWFISDHEHSSGLGVSSPYVPTARDFGIYAEPAEEPQAHLHRPAGRLKVYADSVEMSSGKRGRPGPGGMRGACVGFSRSSRRRLIRALARVRTENRYSYFVTLTYPGAYSPDWERWKRDLKVWRQRLMRNKLWRDILLGGVWRVEFQKRGAPHFHLIIWTSQPLDLSVPRSPRYVFSKSGKRRTARRPSFKEWLSESWYVVVNSGDLRHYRAGTQVKALDSRRSIRLYVSKYVAKVPDGQQKIITREVAENYAEDTPEWMKKPYDCIDERDSNQPDGWGRNWGFFGIVENEPAYDIELSESDYVVLRRFSRRWLRARSRSLSRRSNSASSSGRPVHRGSNYYTNLRYVETFQLLAMGLEGDSTGPPAILRMVDFVLSFSRDFVDFHLAEPVGQPDYAEWSRAVQYLNK